MHLPTFNQLSRLQKFSLLGVFVLTLGLFVSVQAAMQSQESRSQAATTTTIVEDTSRGTGFNQFELVGTWTKCSGCQPPTSNSSFYYASAKGAKAVLRFTGTQVKIYGVKEVNGGIVSVSIDGGAATNIDTYAATKVAALIYASSVLPLGNHTITLTNTGTKNALAKATVLAIDKAAVIKTTVDATPTPSAVPTPTAVPLSNATLYGKEGTFGQLASAAALPSGQSFKAAPVTGWGFLPGQSAFFSARASTGEIVIGTTPLTDNQVYATGDTMNIGVFNPTTNTFRNISVPTTTGATNVTNPFSLVGGASVESIVPVTVGGQPQLAFISLISYHGWDIVQNGMFPTLGYLNVVNGAVQYNAAISQTANQIFAKGGLSAAACPQSANIFNQQVAGCRGLGEMALLPLSQKFVITQYFPDTANGQYSGRIIVMNTDGSVAASYTYPNIPNASGGFLTVNPREVVVDPTATGSLEYFSVIFDVADNGVQNNFPLQEFAYNRSTNQITPISAPIFTGQTATSGQIYRFETAMYDSLGNLWATQALSGSLAGGPIVVYTKNSGVRKLETATCTVTLPWTGIGWGKTCAPDKTVAGTDAYGQTRAFIQDPTSKTVFAATLSGYLMRVKQSGSGTGIVLTNLSPINIGLDKLVDRNTKAVGVRKGVVDVPTRSLYIPVVQTYNQTDCPTWPGSTPCALQPFDQWLYRFNLAAISS